MLFFLESPYPYKHVNIHVDDHALTTDYGTMREGKLFPLVLFKSLVQFSIVSSSKNRKLISEK